MKGLADVGDVRRVVFNFKDATTGNAVDPTTVVVTVTKPDLSTTLPPVVNDPGAVGRFYVDVNVDQAGTWKARAVTTSPQCAEKHTFVSIAA